MFCPKMNDWLIDAQNSLLAVALPPLSAFPNAIKACLGGSVSMVFYDQALKIPIVHLYKAADDLFLSV